MNITRAESVQGISPVNQSRQDDYERNIQKQINDLQKKMKNITSDKEMTSEQKKSEKQAVQEEIQSLNDELRQYQIQKRQEEAAKKQEEVKQKMQDCQKEEESEKEELGLGGKEAGVILSLSSTTEQIAGLKKIRTNLEGKLRTAETEEEKAELQEKINNVSKGIGTKIKVTEETIAEYQETLKDKSDKKNNQKNAQETDTRQRIIIKESDTDSLLQKKVLPQQSALFSDVVIRSNR